jgi:hypothetical protein
LALNLVKLRTVVFFSRRAKSALQFFNFIHRVSLVRSGPGVKVPGIALRASIPLLRSSPLPYALDAFSAVFSRLNRLSKSMTCH